MHPKPRFEELDYRKTPLGELILRRRTILSLENREVYEVLLGESFLMSSLFTEVEVALSNLGLAATEERFPDTKLNVVVGGLGLGYTARAALKFPSVKSLRVVDYLEPVIEWHQQGMVPLGPELTADSRCQFVHNDFFELGFDPENPDKKFHAVLLDIDHSPANLLHERHAAFYAPDGLRKLCEKIHPGGIFALWSDDAPEENFLAALNEVFETCESHTVSFYNPLQDKDSASTVYVAKMPFTEAE
ncbi:MAG: spermidine synthase [Verrucomicrobiales bacterium]